MNDESHRSHSRVLRAVPNLLTVLRLVIGLAFFFLPEPWRLPAFLVSAFTEWFDGFLARRLDATSRFGRILDPVADKVFVFAVVVTLLWEARLGVPELVGIGLRDLAVVLGCTALILAGRSREAFALSPNLVGKLTTVLQFAYLLSFFVWPEPPRALFWITATTSGIAGITYIATYLKTHR